MTKKLDQPKEEATTVQSLTSLTAVPSVVDRFTELYNQLNPEQKAAVETIEGPVMVIAGPGTGKTQILTLRIANILRKTQMNPRNILALTFTDNAAQNMRKRLVSIIGSAGYGVGIYTFHGFANLIITEFPYKFQFAKELQQIDDIEQIEIIENLLDRLPLEALRPPRAPYHYCREIISRISELKRENIDPEQLRELANAGKARIEADPASYHEKGAHKGKMRASLTEELHQLDRCLELSAVYREYQAAMTERGLYDYDDMILFVVRQLEEDPELKAYYQERFQYILVDEYQDTNNSQNRLLELLADFFEEPNLFVVGDDKQSIFRFQGASMANLLLFHKRYPQIKIISLVHNYRSPQTILDGSHQVISQAQERITHHLQGISDQLKSALAPVADPTLPPISLGAFPTTDSELYWIGQRIHSLVTSGSRPEEIAVIYKENREAEAFAELFGRLQIPYTLERGSNVIVDPDIRRLLTILQAIADPTDSRALFELLHYDFTPIQPIDLLRIMRHRAKYHLSILETLDKLPCNCPTHQANKIADQEAVIFTDCQAISRLYQQIGEWRQTSLNHSLPELIETVVNQSGLFTQISQSADRIMRFHRLRRFFEEAKRLANKTPSLRLEDFLTHINRLIENNIQLVPEPLDLESQVGAVRLMTAHKAKGLEFQHVFMPRLVDRHWGNATRRTLIKLPASIIDRPVQPQEEKNEDDRRLFYVGLTRAKQCLYLTYANSKDGKEQLPSQFLLELGEQHVLPITDIPDEATVTQRLTSFFTPIKESLFTDQEADYIRSLIKEQPLTPTGLNNYLRCPRGYLYKNILRVPTAKTAQQGYGTAIHAAMQRFFLQHKATKHVPSLDDLLTAFEEALKQEILSEAEYRDFSRVGRQVLTKYYETHLQAVTPTVAVEYSFAPHHVTLDTPAGPIQITGVLDKLELIDPASNGIRVIDYKTGRARSRNEIEGKTAKADQDYKRQLIFYQLLADIDRQFPYKVLETGLAFVDDDGRFPIEKFTITKEETADLKELIGNIYKQLLDLEFPHIEDPNKPPCEFCGI